MARHYGKVFEQRGGDIYLDFKVNKITENSQNKAVRIEGESPGQVSTFSLQKCLVVYDRYLNFD